MKLLKSFNKKNLSSLFIFFTFFLVELNTPIHSDDFFYIQLTGGGGTLKTLPRMEWTFNC